MSERRAEIRSMLTLLALLLVMSILVMASSGCSTGSTAEGRWQHEITTDGSRTVVHTFSGSIWGGTGRLVEEASIGATDGPDEYLLGSVQSLYAGNDQILVLDRQVPTLRVYDMEGRHIRDIGRKGGGPGELESPRSVLLDPSDGRIFIRDGRQGRLNVYSPEGESVDTWPLVSGISTSRQMVLTNDGDLFTSVFTSLESGRLRVGMAVVGPEGAGADTLMEPQYNFEPWEVEMRNENSIWIEEVPFAPSVWWAMCPDRSVVGGVSKEYQFEIFHHDGVVTVVKKEWDRVPVQLGEARWYRDRVTADFRAEFPGWAWNGKDVPGHKPAFVGLQPDLNGRIWVRCQGPGIHHEGCDEKPEDSSAFYRDPCWTETYFFDVFDMNGRYLGRVDAPDKLLPRPVPFIDGDLFLGLVEDEDGTLYVKRYRLELPASTDEDR